MSGPLYVSEKVAAIQSMDSNQNSTRAVEPASGAGPRAKNVQMVEPKPERAIWFLALQFEIGG